jgi:putative component of membrane protein insertase Oxa1/YidC/SpoIIIJ protein YidD
MRPSEDLFPSLDTPRPTIGGDLQGSPVIRGNRSTYAGRSVGNSIEAAFRTVPTLLAYAVVYLLMRVAPDGENFRRKIKRRRLGESESTGFRNCGGFNLVGYFVSIYQRSLLHNYLHRTGDPCRFIPSCSEYAVRATEKYGFWRGLMLIGDRFRRCTPSYRGDHWVDFP